MKEPLARRSFLHQRRLIAQKASCFHSMASETGYPPVQALPSELRHYCSAYLEERLYTQAFNLLSSVISSRSTASGKVFAPPSQYLALAATLTVHPTTTTRSKSDEYLTASNSALHLLNLANKILGPIGGRFRDTFVFDRFANSRNERKYTTDGESTLSGADGTRVEPLNLDLAQGNSLWSRAEDFWHVVGWALNCSILHPKRWARWHLFLQFMCNVLEDDWKAREKEFKEMPPADSKSKRDCSILTESLIFNYISTTSNHVGSDRRILRAIFADGSQSSTNEFREIFRNELQEVSKEKAQASRRKGDINIDEEIYGDYLDNPDQEEEDEEDQDDPIQKTSGGSERVEARVKRQRRSTRKKSGKDDIPSDHGDDGPLSAQYDKLDHLGSLESLTIRQRLLYLLSCVSNSIPEHFMTLPRLYSFYVEFIRHLPLPTFQLFASPSVLTHFPPACQTTLCEMLLFSILENAAPASTENFLSQSKLERCFLPFTAKTNSVIDNARVSILLESLIRLLAISGLIFSRPRLSDAVAKGIEARSKKARIDVKRGQNKKLTEEFGWVWLIESGDRMVHFVNNLLPNEPEPDYIVIGSQ
ncbi:uncharacterized protein ARB_07783 [Trichophyton benhamiae CBS 112371]|uniref:Uncharacterized protein n=1 Tax=Arthroderma benhamiae (strain ATCC MYA-4681 / CBS 112371) TaxID=663331 RepID=D4ATX0_ARTBC|nr:uncharacterized protein ARB_07783 [Trichophyton benhamiae CBS 112371]EFE33423.1 conserved hypothetical protein [Trichophyton benhamiae CBS 112371]